jgi:hypothetical protein
MLYNVNAMGNPESFAYPKNNLRIVKNTVNYDNGVIVELGKVPDTVHTLTFYLKINNL